MVVQKNVLIIRRPLINFLKSFLYTSIIYNQYCGGLLQLF